MGDFQRSPSKVWWHEDSIRNFSAGSPGSQDSGFSDTENSPPIQAQQQNQQQSTPQRRTPPQCLPKDILKNISEEDSVKSQNLSVNFKHKNTPKKSISLTISETNQKNASYNALRTPARNDVQAIIQSEPIKRHRFFRNSSLKVSRNLFSNMSKRRMEKLPTPYQYSEDTNVAVESQYMNTNSKVVHDASCTLKSDDSNIELLEGAKTFPTDESCNYALQKNQSAPAILKFHESRRDFSDTEFLDSSDCESELEFAFHGLLDQPKQTSTPKTLKTMKLQRSKRISRLSAIYDNERVPNFNEEVSSVQKWIQEARDLYEPECMTTLQCKSIAAELNQKVAAIASRMTLTLRKLLMDSEMISLEFANIKNQQQQHAGPLAQSLARLIEEFVQNYITDTDVNVLQICANMRNHLIEEDFPKVLHQLHSKWSVIQNEILVQEIKQLVNELVDPHSEIHVRAALTGLTSVALRNKEVADIFISCNSIQILCILCEKCESSTVRSLILRALSTVCTNTIAIRQLESSSGISLLSEIISEESRPEPERSESVALLAQITAPWIEDNRSVRGLQDHVKALVKALTSFITNTKCCQNLLLCTAALANLTEMEPKSVKYILHQNSVGIILNAIKKRNALVSVYLIEQVATLIANLSSKTNTRKSLVEENAPAALLHFLHSNYNDPDVESRLQQKSVIALSRLSCDPEGARQIVQLNGVSRLVKLCRDHKERFNSDAVLVAALATLRKVAESCGKAVIDTIDVQELIEPRLLDSFLAYSAQSESYV